MATQNGRIQMELVVSSLEDAIAGQQAGADRFELCSALALGGLTPSIGTMELVSRIQLPVMCMIRPREGGMHYSSGEYRTMLKDAEAVISAGAQGLVFGFLTGQGHIDLERCRELVSIAGEAGVETVFHRAFDVVADPEKALEQLVDIGVTRILTSGRAPAAAEGLSQIQRTVEQADGRIEVLPGGGIEVEQIEKIVRNTGCRQVHLYLSQVKSDLSTTANPGIRFGGAVPDNETEHAVLAEDQVRRARSIADRL